MRSSSTKKYDDEKGINYQGEMRMNEHGQRDRELLLSPNEFSYVRDQATGAVNVLVGTKKTLDPGDTPVVYDVEKRRFVPTDVDTSKQVFVEADESSYIVLKNPSTDGKHPDKGTNNIPINDIKIGSKINIPGPVTFPLWPLQVADVVPGHQLRSNQYLICKVYNEEAARANIENAVIKAAEPQGDDIKAVSGRPSWMPEIKATGQLIVIKGTNVSFYIPPTGIEVVPEYGRDGLIHYVREAVTLERLEYCILLDESGEKRYVEGTDVVFPAPTEEFVEKNGVRKFNAIELNEQMGLYIKVIIDYTDGEKEYKTGEEIFITGADQKIYFPCEEHQLIKYDDEYIYYAIAIPKGEGRYVLNKNTGKVETIKGPKMFLPDPRTQVIARRVLDEKTVKLWFPGNEEALVLNRSMEDQVAKKSSKRTRSSSRGIEDSLAAIETKDIYSEDAFERRSEYTPPRTLTLDTKYAGVVGISPWTNYAVQIVPKVGERQVVVGPASILMDYDWELEVLSLSTGTPKNDDKLMRTVYLRIKNNSISDKITAITKDDFDVTFSLKYQVDFTGDPSKWFSVENPISLLTDRGRSMLYNLVKKNSVEEFKSNATDIVRDMMLGPKGEDGKRTGGMDFSNENGMKVIDVTVSPVVVENKDVSYQLVEAQHEIVRDNIELKRMRRLLEIEREKQAAAQEQADIKAVTQKKYDEIKTEQITRAKEIRIAELEAKLAEQENLDSIAEKENARKKAIEDIELLRSKEEMELRTAEIDRKAEAYVKKAEVITPRLAAAIQSASDKNLAGQIAGKVQPGTGGFFGSEDITLETLKNLVKGTPFESAFDDLNGDETRYDMKDWEDERKSKKNR